MKRIVINISKFFFRISSMMEILCGLFGIVRSANVRHLLFCIIGISGVFQLVHGRHRDIDNVQFETGLKYESSKLSSAEESVDDGKLNNMHICFDFEMKPNEKKNNEMKIKIENSINQFNIALYV